MICLEKSFDIVPILECNEKISAGLVIDFLIFGLYLGMKEDVVCQQTLMLHTALGYGAGALLHSGKTGLISSVSDSTFVTLFICFFLLPSPSSFILSFLSAIRLLKSCAVFAT
jgi:hypothetical protein